LTLTAHTGTLKT